MSIRKRTWKTAKGDAREAWVVDYVDQAGKCRLKTFKKKKEADAYHSHVNVEVRQGIHTPESTSVTVAEAARLWLESCRGRGLEHATIVAYQQHADLHIIPFMGRLKLSQVTAPGVREFEDSLRRNGRSPQWLGKLPPASELYWLILKNVVWCAVTSSGISARVVKGVSTGAQTGVRKGAGCVGLTST